MNRNAAFQSISDIDHVDFGAQGKNFIALDYDSPSNRIPNDVVAEIRLNNKDGDLLGKINLPNTGGAWDNYKTATASLDHLVTGSQTICLVFKGSTTSGLLYIGNLDNMKYSKV
ncbi:carbohydrate-binding protein [Paenibacillus sp. R14(2021)]|uniref:carbohydrate-binding protein n=1 Tax=Paenibacillus sp. R14(2021) TaxID=2859228 RepID=UPI001C613955|nr:carbohydrate-binding protein [Paenibacillus sp. R14(2021)]